ncbi:MAG: hypothetical protein CMM58_02010 [Rhodospirillaceae bacterium]|nr:hypothetical protein [Rhodospirillaceae bacterium]
MLFARFGGIQSAKRKKRSSTEIMVRAGIQKQLNILNGNVEKGRNGKPIRSWFRDGIFIPYAGIYPLFGKDNGVSYLPGQEQEILKELIKYLDQGDLAKEIRAVEARITAAREARRKKIGFIAPD